MKGRTVLLLLTLVLALCLVGYAISDFNYGQASSACTNQFVSYQTQCSTSGLMARAGCESAPIFLNCQCDGLIVRDRKVILSQSKAQKSRLKAFRLFLESREDSQAQKLAVLTKHIAVCLEDGSAESYSETTGQFNRLYQQGGPELKRDIATWLELNEE